MVFDCNFVLHLYCTLKCTVYPLFLWFTYWNNIIIKVKVIVTCWGGLQQFSGNVKEGVHEVFGLEEPTPEDAVLSLPGNLTASTSRSRMAHLWELFYIPFFLLLLQHRPQHCSFHNSTLSGCAPQRTLLGTSFEMLIWSNSLILHWEKLGPRCVALLCWCLGVIDSPLPASD